MGSLKRNIQRIRRDIGSAVEDYPPPEEWPIEAWAQSRLSECTGPALYYTEYKTTEEVLEDHAEFDAGHLHFWLCLRAWQTYRVTSQPHPLWGVGQSSPMRL